MFPVADVTFNAGAGAYDRFTGRWSLAFRSVVLAAARVRVGETVLEVSAGTGVLAERAAAQVGASGRVLATDISLPMLREAQAKIAGLPVYTVAMDGQELACRDQSCDAVICQLGLMYLPDAARGLREFRRVLRPQGRLAAQVWSVPARVPYLGFLADALSRHFPDDREAVYSPTALADQSRLERLLAGAGFTHVSVVAETQQVVFGSFEDYWSGIEGGGGKLGQFYLQLPDTERREVRAEVSRRMLPFESAGRLVLTAEALIGTGVA